MNDVALLLLFVVAMLSIPFTFRQYRAANAEQRRQIVIAAVGAITVAGGMLAVLAFR